MIEHFQNIKICINNANTYFFLTLSTFNVKLRSMTLTKMKFIIVAKRYKLISLRFYVFIVEKPN